MFRFYARLLESQPWKTQMATAGVLFSAGDLVAQHVYEPLIEPAKKRPSLVETNWIRTARMAAYGTLVAGPSTFAWYRWLERNITLKQPLQVLVTRVALDQMLFAPTFIGVFLTSMAAIDAMSPGQIKEKLRDTYPRALAMNYQIWPLVQVLNFYFVPLKY